MKNMFIASLAMAAMTVTASAGIVNGDFSDGANGWSQFGGAEGPYGVGSAFGFDNGSDAVVAYGTFSGTPNFSGFTQDISGGYSEGDTINFGGQMYIENGKELFGGNNANIQLNFWYGDGTAYGFTIVGGTVNSSSLSDTVYDIDFSYTLDAGAAAVPSDRGSSGRSKDASSPAAAGAAPPSPPLSGESAEVERAVERAVARAPSIFICSWALPNSRKMTARKRLMTKKPATITMSRK